MKTCTYISGPSCVGKSTVALAVSRSVSGIAHVRGDDYWRTYPGLSFEERVSETNRDIVAALRNSDSSDVLCEWVPCRGPFVAQLYDTCVSLERQFLHVVLTAPLSVLRNRKRERDRDDEAGAEVVPVPDQQNAYRCLVCDTEKEGITRIADEISKWILSNQELKHPSSKPRRYETSHRHPVSSRLGVF